MVVVKVCGAEKDRNRFAYLRFAVCHEWSIGRYEDDDEEEEEEEGTFSEKIQKEKGEGKRNINQI